MKKDIRIRDVSTHMVQDNLATIRSAFDKYPDIIISDDIAITAELNLKYIDTRKKSLLVEMNWMMNCKPDLFKMYPSVQYSLRKLYSAILIENGFVNNKYFDGLSLWTKTHIFDRVMSSYFSTNNRNSEFYEKQVLYIIDNYFKENVILKNNFDLSDIVMPMEYVECLYNLIIKNYNEYDCIKILRNIYMMKFEQNSVLRCMYNRICSNRISKYTTIKLMYNSYMFRHKFK